MAHDEDRGVESDETVVELVTDEFGNIIPTVTEKHEHATDALGNPAADEDDRGDN